ncbi:MAG TPA: hypothetical protein VIJ93_10040, partial [bacterium]
PPGGDALSSPSAMPGTLPAPGPAIPAPAPAATQGVSQLVEEFKNELSAMEVDLPQLEDAIDQVQLHNESFDNLQKRFLKKTGTEGSGYSRGYFNNFRGFGKDAAYPAMDYNADIFMDWRLRSVPVPNILFDATIRFWRSSGMYYADPIPSPRVDLRWLSLTSFNEYSTVTAGDFFQHYTPLILWNAEIPVYTFIEPTSYHRTRKDVEELIFMNHGPDWRLRGFQASTAVAWPDNPVLSLFKTQVMAGPLKQASQFGYGDYFAGSQSSLSFLNNNVEFKGAGLLIWDDNNSANVPYLPTFPLTFAKQYQIGSLSSRINVPFDTDVSITGTAEYAGSNYQDDLNNPLRVFQDWAMFGTGALNISGFHLTAKYYNVGPYFYSPGAQTNRFTPGNGTTSYLSNTSFGREDFLPGYLNNFVFQNASRPSFVPYDRMAENVLPYGDASPNRIGLITGLTLDIGTKGCLKIQGSYMPTLSGMQMREIQPNFVLNGAGTGSVAVDSTTNTAAARTFGGYEGALTFDFAKAFDLKEKIYQIAFDYKNQTTDLGLGASPYTVNTLIGAVDFTIPIAGFDKVVLSGAFEQAQSTGSEYVLSGSGKPPTYANYPFYLDSSSLGNYTYTPLNITRTSWAVGFLYPLSKTINFRGDYFFNQYTWIDNPTFDRREGIWRFTYELSF